MTIKSDFQQKVNGMQLKVNSGSMWIEGKYQNMLYVSPLKSINSDPICPLASHSSFEVKSLTASPWTQKNFDNIFNSLLLENKVGIWKDELIAKKEADKKWRKDNRRKVVDYNKRQMILKALKTIDIKDQEIGSDDHDISISQYIYKQSDLKKYYATGRFLAIVTDTRTRTYAKSCQWKASERIDKFLVGENENGNCFAHQIPNKINNIDDAYNWIWNNAEIIARQGDVGIAPSNLKHKNGEEMDIDVMGHSRHRFIGEVYRNVSLHIRSGFLYHTGNQHPPIYLDGSKWRRVVIGRRSDIGMSSAD